MKTFVTGILAIIILVFAQNPVVAQFATQFQPTIVKTNPQPQFNQNFQFSQPDLIVEHITISDPTVKAGKIVGTIKVTVRNIGKNVAFGTNDKPKNGYMVDLFLSTDKIGPNGWANVPQPYRFQEDMLLIGGRISNTVSLEPGQRYTYASYEHPIPEDMELPCERQTLYLGAFVDAGNAVAESNERNNTNFLPLRLICGEGRPDLIITQIQMPNSVVSPGQTVPKMLITVKNIGTADALGTDRSANGYMVDLILSTDNFAPIQWAQVMQPGNFPEDMLFVGGRVSNTKTLAPGQSFTYVETNSSIPAGVDLHNPCGVGRINVGAVVDPGQKVAESNEGNNTKFKQVRLNCEEQAPDLVITSIEIEEPVLIPGERVPTIAVTVRNIGAVEAIGTDRSNTGYMIDMILSTDNQAPIQWAQVMQPGDFPEDMLFVGGRVSNTVTLTPGQSHTYKLREAEIPAGVDLHNPCGVGRINIGGVVDPGQNVAESNEGNNTNFLGVRLRCN